MTGQLDVLNVGEGHLKFSITDGDPIELDRARRVIEDMLRRGFAIFVETEDGPSRVQRFDPERLVYVIADVPANVGGKGNDNGSPPGTSSEPAAAPKRRGRPPKTREVKVSEAKATAVGRSAGG